MIPLSEVKQLQVIESSLHVQVRGDEVCLDVRTVGPGGMFRAKMPTVVWREFCRRQLAVPPPLPPGGAS